MAEDSELDREPEDNAEDRDDTRAEDSLEER